MPTNKISKEDFKKALEKFNKSCDVQIEFGKEWYEGKFKSIEKIIENGVKQHKKDIDSKKIEVQNWDKIVDNINKYAEQKWKIKNDDANETLEELNKLIKDGVKNNESFKERLLDWKEFILDEIGRYRNERDAKLSITSGQIDEYLKEEKNKDFAEALKLTGDDIPLNNLFFAKIRDSYLPKSKALDAELKDLDNKIKQKKEEIEKQLS